VASRHEKEDKKYISDDDEDDDAMLMGNDGKFDVHEKIGRMITSEQNKPAGKASKFKLTLNLNDNLPTDLKEEAIANRPLMKSAAFEAQSRDQQQAAVARRHDPPELTKYTPRMAIVRPKPNAAVIHH
jgi:hypothetical protein